MEFIYACGIKKGCEGLRRTGPVLCFPAFKFGGLENEKRACKMPGREERSSVPVMVYERDIQSLAGPEPAVFFQDCFRNFLRAEDGGIYDKVKI